ncbi:TetR/AcrR family transcriptional regulator [Brevibacterium aurantiacum]|uniref:TetR/AcrR family transcriptional regulator n=1 Tax=Brevibacterium aurantiacum TaxID=273384 RepID=A0A556CMT0_BREAU|nr:TetR/AcrR family transcriptional regulator [Brevibacterium aurantiacum]TSI18729.1 TetR/AcrR family transcriptional regulator [Brevibacterium aurantiacum]
MPDIPQRSSRPLRADAEQSIARILIAAEQVFAADPSATLEAVASAAGVARATVHRRFSSRDDLRDALVNAINTKLRDAIASANTDTAPPLVALYQLTVATLDLKVDWRASWQLIDLDATDQRGIDPSNISHLDALLQRSQDAGLFRPGIDIPWARSVYMALIHEASTIRSENESASHWANRIMQTLLSGIGNNEHNLEALLAQPPTSD